jgi:NADH:ubiquinone oxidoreductase subunit C
MQQKKQTAANQRTAEMQLAKEQVCMLLELSSYDYNEMQYHCGLSFLAYKCQWEVSEERVQKSKIFWAWWMNNWAYRDEQFLAQYQLMSVDEYGDLTIKEWSNKAHYLLINNPSVLSSKVDDYGASFHASWVQILNIINNEFIKQSV